MKSINFKELIKGIIVIGAYFVLPYILVIPLIFLTFKIRLIPNEISTLILYLALATIFVVYYRKDLLANLKGFKKEYKFILKTSLKYWGLGFLAMYVSSLLIQLLHLPEVTNQEENIQMLKQYPIVEFILAGFFAPLIEELVFRRSLVKATTNKHLYAFTTGIIFALIHITTSLSEGPLMLLYVIPYASLGVSFGYAYYKTKNIYGTIIVHSLHNLITLTLMFILIKGGLM